MKDDRLSLLIDLGAMLHREVGLDDLLREMGSRIARALEAERATVFVVDAATGELRSRIADLAELKEIRLPLGQGIAGAVATTGKSIRVDDVSKDPRFFAGVDERTGFRTKSLLAVPMRDARKATRGVVQAVNKREGHFTAEDEAFLSTLASQIALAFEWTSLRSDGAARGVWVRGPYNHIIGDSPAMKAVYDVLKRVSPTDASVLLTGETGTGKGLVARAIAANGPRADGPFVTVDCTTLPEALVESELFGHERGAFTGADRRVQGKVEGADGGTLFLDEVGELPPAAQAKLLRLLQERRFERVGGRESVSVDVRIITATHRQLLREVKEGRFREDLFYRLRVVEIELPPLRARGAGEIAALAKHFLGVYARRHQRDTATLGATALAAMAAHHWPGNVRELEHAVERAVVLSDGEIGPEHLGLLTLPPSERPPTAGVTLPLDLTLEEASKRYCEAVLAATGGNSSEAARRLSVGRNTLARKRGLVGRSGPGSVHRPAGRERVGVSVVEARVRRRAWRGARRRTNDEERSPPRTLEWGPQGVDAASAQGKECPDLCRPWRAFPAGTCGDEGSVRLVRDRSRRTACLQRRSSVQLSAPPLARAHARAREANRRGTIDPHSTNLSRRHRHSFRKGKRVGSARGNLDLETNTMQNQHLFTLGLGLLCASSACSGTEETTSPKTEELGEHSSPLAGQFLVAPGLPFRIEGNSLCATVRNGSTAEGTAIDAGWCLGAKTQQYFAVPAQPGASPNEMAYEIRTAAAGRCLQDKGAATGTTLYQGDCAAATGTHWKIRPSPTAGIEVANTDTGRKISFGPAAILLTSGPGAGFTSDINPRLAPLDTLVLRPRHSASSGMCIDVAGGSATNNAAVQQWNCTGNSNQRWQLIPTNSNDFATISTTEGTKFSIKAKGTNQCLDRVIGTTTLQTYACHGGENQQFTFFANQEGYWTIKSYDGQCLDIAGASTSANAALKTYSCTGGSNQQFSTDGWSSRAVRVSIDPGGASPPSATISAAINVANQTFGVAGLKISTFTTQGAGNPAVEFTGHIQSSCGGASNVMEPLALGKGGCPSACTAPRDTWDIHLTHELGHSLGLLHTGSDITDQAFCAGANADGDGLADTPPMTLSQVLPSSCTSSAPFQCASGGRSFATTPAMGYAYALRADGGRDLSPAQRLAVRATLYARGFEQLVGPRSPPLSPGSQSRTGAIRHC